MKKLIVFIRVLAVLALIGLLFYGALLASSSHGIPARTYYLFFGSLLFVVIIIIGLTKWKGNLDRQ